MTDNAMTKQMLEDFSDPDFERSLERIRNLDRHLAKIRAMTAALKASRDFIKSCAPEGSLLIEAIDRALAVEPQVEG